MARLIYSALTSLDGYIEDEQGSFAWAQPNEDLHRFINKLESQTELMLLGRKMYETMAVWDTDEMILGMPDYIQEYAQVWRRAEKIVFSRILTRVTTSKTTLRSDFNSDEIRQMKTNSTENISIGGADLGGTAIKSGLVDEIYLFVFPVIVGRGKPALPRGASVNLALMETKTFDGGAISLRYSVQ